MAQLDLARGNHTSAGTRLLAIGNPGDWLVAYFAGVGIADLAEYRRENASPEDVQAARRLFEIVRQRHGEVANALARLAKLELRSAAGPTKETRAAVERARLMATGREDYAILHAQVAARLGDFAAARNVAGPLLRSDNAPEIREAARSLMGYIARLEEAAKEESAAAADAEKKKESPADDAPTAPAEPRPLFRDLRPGEQRIEGLLERIDCAAKGSAVFHVQTADGPAQAAAPRMADVDFITYRDDLTGKIGCGPMKPPVSVYLTWRGDSAKPAIKVAVAVEFLPKQ